MISLKIKMFSFHRSTPYVDWSQDLKKIFTLEEVEKFDKQEFYMKSVNLMKSMQKKMKNQMKSAKEKNIYILKNLYQLVNNLFFDCIENITHKFSSKILFS